MKPHYLTCYVCFTCLFISACGFDGGPIIKEGSTDDFRYGLDFEDSQPLSLRVQQALKDNPRTMHLGVKVSTVKNDVVKLTGFVNTDELIVEAERTAYQIDGVRFVINSLVKR